MSIPHFWKSATSFCPGAAQGSSEAEGLLVPGVDAVPAELLFQVPGEGGLHQKVFTVDAGDHDFYERHYNAM